MGQFGVAIGALVAAVIGLAALSVIVSRQSNTPGVISAFGSGLGSIITAAVAPVAAGGGGVGATQNIGYGSFGSPVS